MQGDFNKFKVPSDNSSHLSKKSYDGQLSDQMEMMIIGNPGDNVRMEYVEEPSRHPSMFESHKNTSEREFRDKRTRDCLIKTAVSFLCLGISTYLFKVVYINYRHTIFEDIYGRGVIFFICSFIHYLLQKGPISMFELKVQIRTTLFFRVLFSSMAYVFIYLAILNTSSFVYIDLIICVLPTLCKVVQRQAMIEKNYSILDLVCFVASIVGLVLLYQGNTLYATNFKYNYNNMLGYIFGILGTFCWAISIFLLHKQASHIHHSIDTLFTSLFMTVLVPAFLLGYFSAFPTDITYDWVQLVYFIITGILTWVFHSQFTEVIQQDVHNSYLVMVYVNLGVGFVVDAVAYEQVMTLPQAIAFMLIVGPNAVLILLRSIGLMKK